MSDGLDRKEFLTGFVAECEEHIQSSVTNLLAIEETASRGTPQPRRVRALFRSLHTIKGLAAMVGVEPIVELAHAMETVLREADRSAGRLTPGAIELLMKGLRAIEERVRAVSSGDPVAPAPRAVLEGLEALEDPDRPSPETPRAVLRLEPELAAKLTPAEEAELIEGARRGLRVLRVDFIPSRELAAAGATITSVRQRLAELAEIVKIIPRTLPSAADGGIAFVLLIVTRAADEPLAAAASTAVANVRAILPDRPEKAAVIEDEDPTELGGQRRGLVRVEIARLDDVLEKLSALVVTRFRMQRCVQDLAAQGADVRRLAEVVADNARQLRDLRGSIMRTRMVSLEELLEQMPLLVRGLSRTTGKQVAFELDTGHAELDKAVGERIFPAIVHIVRNAFDHGLEAPEARRAAGKPEAGRIRISAHERSANQLELSIADDGGGIDAAAVARRAGRPVPDSDAALLDLLCAPGFTTLDAATKTSGRGMGMDIARRAVTQLGGQLSLKTSLGVGTTFALHIPLTIAIVDAFNFTVGGRQFVVPVGIVDEVIEVDPAGALDVPVRPGAIELRMIERRGEPVTLVPLGPLVDAAGAPGTRALVVRRDGETYAFAIDRVLGKQEVVVRPLEDPLVSVLGVSGATDLGDGRPTLVLDLIALSRALHREGAPS